MPRINLRSLILLLAVTTALLTLANTFYASYQVQRDLLIQQTLEANRVYAAKLADSTESFLKETRQQLAYSAGLLAPAFALPAQLTEETERLQRQGNTFNSVSIVGADGVVLATSPQSLQMVGILLTSSGSREALQKRQPLISEPYISSATGRLILFISHPIFATDGRYLGYVGGTLYLKENSILDTLLREHYYRDGSYLYVVDRHSRLLYHKDSERVGEQVLGNPVIQAVVEGRSGSQRVINSQGIDMLAGYAPVASTGWGIVVQRPTAATLGEMNGLMLGILRNVIPVSLLILLCIWWLSRLISRPLWQLASNARQMDAHAASEQIRQVSSWYYEAAQLKHAMLAGLAQLNLKIGKLNLDSITDPLTGLLNRRGMQIPLEQWQSGGQPFAVIAIDIDHFKEVNDRFGHDIGDQLLRHLAQLMQQVSRQTDVLCRNGGEEFVMLLPGTSLADACGVAERLRQCLADNPSPHGTVVTISLGVAHCADSRLGVEEVLRQADQALYAAKNQGRNRVVTAGAL